MAKEQEEEGTAQAEAERNEVKAKLRELGIEFHPASGLKKLIALLPENQEVEAPKVSIRQQIGSKSREAISEAEILIIKLRELELLARNNYRPSRHFGIFAQNIDSFIRRFNKMLR